MHPGRPIGRDDTLKEVYGHLREQQPVLIHGASGVGKTTLAAALAAAYTQQPGGVLWLDGDQPALAALLVHVGRAYKLTNVTNSQTPGAYIGAVSNALMQNKPFIVIDNLKSATLAAQFIEKCAHGQPMLLLSDDALAGNWTRMNLEPLEDMQAVVLFKQKSGLTDSASDINVYGIVKLLAYQPLPIVIAARGMAASKQSADAYLKTLQQFAANVGNDGPLAALTVSYRSLNNALQGLLLMLGATFRGEASAQLLSVVGGVPLASIAQAMTVLSQLYLVEQFTRYGEMYYRVHPFVHRFAQTWLKGSNRLQGLQTKVRDGLLTYAQQHAQARNFDKLAMEMQSFVAAALFDSEKGERETANQLVVSLTQADDFVQERGYVYELLRLRGASSGSTSAFPAYGPEAAATAMIDDADDADDDDAGYEDDVSEYTETASGIPTPAGIPAAGSPDSDADVDDFAAEDYADDAEHEAAAFDDLEFEEGMSGSALRDDALENIDVEQLRQALVQARQQNDSARQVQILKAIGRVQVSQGREAEAIGSYNEILNLYDEAEDEAGTLETLDMLSSLLTKTDNCQAAVMHATRGLQLADKLQDQQTEMHLHSTLGTARQELGETEAAVGSFTKALEIARMTDDTQAEALVLYKLGYAYLDDGEAERAIETLTQARDLFRGQSKRGYEGRVMGALGSAYSAMGRWSEAIQYHKSAVYIAREARERDEEALQLSNLGKAQIETGQLPDALLSYRQALHLAYDSGDRTQIVSAITELVSLMMRSNRLLSICDVLLRDAETMDPSSREVQQLRQQLDNRRRASDERGLQQAHVDGSAREYAANAYELLEA